MLRKFAATTSTAALAIGMLAAGAGVAAAQGDDTPPEENTGSMSTGSLGLDLEKTAADLELANQALNGPVDLTPGDEGGATITFENTTAEPQNCFGLVFPYSSVADAEVDPSDPAAGIGLLGPIEEGGDVTILGVSDDGEPVTTPFEGEGLTNAVFPLLNNGVAVESEESIVWESAGPAEPAAAAVICGFLSSLDIGIDKQVVADQINDKIPGGSVAPASPDSISGGSVELGATALGSLAGGGEDEGDTGDDGDTGDNGDGGDTGDTGE